MTDELRSLIDSKSDKDDIIATIVDAVIDAVKKKGNRFVYAHMAVPQVLCDTYTVKAADLNEIRDEFLQKH